MNDKFRLWTLFVDQTKDIQDIGNHKAIGTLTDKDIVRSNEYEPNFGVERFQDAIFQVPKQVGTLQNKANQKSVA